jgi:CBS domain containing-hemolysin-like protein
MNHSRRIIQVGMTMTQQASSGNVASGWTLAAAALVALLAAAPAHASFLHGDSLAKAANVIAWIVIVIVPIVAVVVFWLVHILPEKIAHKNHHPQTKAIQVLCLLSLVFGGLLWPLAWLWANTKPVLYKMAYGTDKAEPEHAAAPASVVAEGSNLRADVARLRRDLETLVSRGGAPAELTEIRDRLAALEPRLAAKAEEAR